ncbi:MAG: ABC transporter DrrB family efflux protein [Verrucomicrobiales bacterium]|jgi:ABC transporter DrrB family efflux protein
MNTSLASATDQKSKGVGLKQAIRDIAIILKRNAMRNVRLPELVIFATIQPVMFLLLFNYVFGGSIGSSLNDAYGGKYVNFLLPGMLVQTALFSSIQTAVGLTEDLSAGVIDRFRSLPIARSAVLAGRTLADMTRTFFVMLLLLAVGFIIGFDAPGGPLRTLAGLALCALFGFAMSWVMALVGLVVKTPEAANSAGFLPLFPLMFASSIFVPPETLPSWMKGFANNQPITVLSDTLRGLILGDEFISTQSRSLGGLVLYSLFWIVVIIAVFAPLAVRKYRRTVA